MCCVISCVHALTFPFPFSASSLCCSLFFHWVASFRSSRSLCACMHACMRVCVCVCVCGGACAVVVCFGSCALTRWLWGCFSRAFPSSRSSPALPCPLPRLVLSFSFSLPACSSCLLIQPGPNPFHRASCCTFHFPSLLRTLLNF
jgi:hypothetical protein